MEDRFQKVRSSLIDILKEGLSSLGEMSAENVKSWMDYRRSIFLVTITLLVAVTPFADSYVHSPRMFWTGYIVLLASAVLGLISEEIRHWMRHKIFEHGKRHTKNAIDKLFESESGESLKAAHNLFMQAGNTPRYLEIVGGGTMLASTVAMGAFIVGLVLVAISVAPLTSPGLPL